MADRHGKITRWYTVTNYTVEKMTANGKQTEECEDFGGLSRIELEAAERLRMNRKNEIFLNLTITNRERRLYGQDQSEFRRTAKVLATEPALDI